MPESSPPSAPPPPPRMRPPGPFAALRRVLARGETIRLLTTAQLVSGHRDKLLGNVWNLLDPLLTLAVYYLVFGLGFRQAAGAPREFVLHLFVGIVVWRFFGESVAQAAGCLRSQRSLILAADFPRAVIPIAVCLARFYDLVWSLAVVAGAAWLFGTGFAPTLAWLGPVLVLLFAFTLGLCFLVASAGLFFADTTNLVNAFLRLWVLVSPIFYFARSAHGREGIVPPGLLDYYMLNPIAGLLEAFRDALIWQATPRAGDLGYVAGVSLGLLVLGFVVFARGEGRYAKLV